MATQGPALHPSPPPPGIQGLRPLSVGGLIDAAIKIYRSRWKTLVISVAIVTIPVLILTALVQASAGPSSRIVRSDATTGVAKFDTHRFGVFLGSTLVLLVLSTVARALASAAAFRSVSGAYLGDDPDWRESLRFARARLGAVLWVILLTTLLTVVGVLACGIGFFYALGAFSVAVPVLLVENVHGSGALRRSQELVRGRFWPVLGVVLLSSLMAAVIQGAITSPAIALTLNHSNFLVTLIMQMIGNIIGTVLVTPFSAAVVMALYVDLRVRKEGFDLMLLAQRLGAVPPAGGFPAQPGPVAAGSWGPGWPAGQQGWGPAPEWDPRTASWNMPQQQPWPTYPQGPPAPQPNWPPQQPTWPVTQQPGWSAPQQQPAWPPDQQPGWPAPQQQPAWPPPDQQPGWPASQQQPAWPPPDQQPGWPPPDPGRADGPPDDPRGPDGPDGS